MVTKGIRNNGSLCYIIAVLVQLHAREEFREPFLLLAASHIAIPNVLANTPTLQCIEALRQLFISMKEHSNDEVDLLPFYLAFQGYLVDEVDVDRLGDSTEFFSNLCRLIKDFEKLVAAERGSLKSLLSLFHGQVTHTLRPVDQPIPETTLEKQQSDSFLYLALDINSGNLSEALEQYSLPSSPFQLPWKVDSTDSNSKLILLPTTRQSTIVNYPPMLILHLRRYTLGKKAKPKKLHDYFAFPMLLDISNTSERVDSSVGKNTEELFYKLRGTVVHAGRDLSSGHNRSIVHLPLAFDNIVEEEDNTGHLEVVDTGSDNDVERDENGSWLLYDDDQVMHYDINDLPEDCFGGLVDSDDDDEEEDDGKFASAVMLFYERLEINDERTVL